MVAEQGPVGLGGGRPWPGRPRIPVENPWKTLWNTPLAI